MTHESQHDDLPGREAAARAVADELEASQRRAVTLVERIDAARDWARRSLTTDQQAGLFAVLVGANPKARCHRCHCPSGTTQCDHCNCCDVPDQRTA